MAAFLFLLTFVVNVAGQVARPDITPGWKREVQWILNGQETLAYKTLSSPTITSPTFTGNWTSTGTLDFTISNTTAAGDRGIVMGITQATNALTGTLDGIYARATGYAASSAAGRVQGGEIGARLPDADGTKSIAEVVGLYSWADAKIGTVAILRGLETSLDGGAGSTTTKAQGLYIANNTSGTQTTSYAIDINEGLRTGVHAAFTYDLRMQYGETLDNNTDGAVQLVSAVWKQAYDAAAYWTATVANAGAVTFDDVSDGTAGFTMLDALTMGADAGGVDVQLYTDAAGSNVLWDASDNRLEGTGDAVILMGEQTTGINSATPNPMIYGNYYGVTTAVTGTAYGVRGNARAGIASPAGTFIGGQFLAGNGKNATTSDGVSTSTLFGVKTGIALSIGAAPATTVALANGVDVEMDIHQVNNVVTKGAGAQIHMIGSTASTNGTIYGLEVINEANIGNGEPFNAAIFVDDINMNGVCGWDYGIDMSGVAAGFTTADMRLGYGATFNNSTADLLTITEGTVAVAGMLTANNYVTTTQSTGVASYPTGLYETLNITGNVTGSAVGTRSIVQMGGSSYSVGNLLGASFAARLANVGDVVSGAFAGVLTGLDMGLSNVANQYAYALECDFTEIVTRAAAPKAFINFQDYDHDGTYYAKYLFDVGGALCGVSDANDDANVLFRTGAGTTNGTSKMLQGLHILINGEEYYIPVILHTDWVDS